MDTIPYSGKIRQCVYVAHQNRRPDTRGGGVCSRLLIFPTVATVWSPHSWLQLFCQVFFLCCLDDFLEIWGRRRQGRQEWWGREYAGKRRRVGGGQEKVPACGGGNHDMKRWESRAACDRWTSTRE